MKIFMKVLILISVLMLLSGEVLFSAEKRDKDAKAASDDLVAYMPETMRIMALDECVRFAVYNSFEVQLAKLDLLIAETDKMYAEAVFDTFLLGNAYYIEDKRQAVSVFAPDNEQQNYYSFGARKEFPTGTEVTATWSDTRDWNNTTFTTVNPSHTAELSVELRQPVGKNFFGYVDRNTITITELAIKNADLETKNRIENLIVKVEKAYWDLVLQKKSVKIFRDMLDRAKSLNDQNEKNFDIGLIEKGDLYASQANLVLKETDLIIAKNNYQRAEANLKLLMNTSDEALIYPADDVDDRVMDRDLAWCLNTAFENRRDYRIRKRDVDIKNITVKMKANEKWPEIDLVGTMAMNGVDRKFHAAAGRTTAVDNVYYYAGVEVTVPVENRQARSEYKKASYEKERAIVSLKDTERTIITEVGNSFRDVETYWVNMANIREAVRLQSDKLQEEEKRFNQGRSNTKRLIDFQNDLILAQLEEAQIDRRYENSVTDLKSSMNTLLGEYEDAL